MEDLSAPWAMKTRRGSTTTTKKRSKDQAALCCHRRRRAAPALITQRRGAGSKQNGLASAQAQQRSLTVTDSSPLLKASRRTQARELSEQRQRDSWAGLSPLCTWMDDD